MPREDAELEDHNQFVADVQSFKTDLSKITKHVNRLFVIGNTQRMKAKMREHASANLNIFDFGIEVKEAQDEEQ